MQIACPNCKTSYDVGTASLGMNGRTVRCVRCRTVWFAAAVGERVRVPIPPPTIAGVVEAPVFKLSDAVPSDVSPPVGDAPSGDHANNVFDEFEQQEKPVRIEPLGDLEARELAPGSEAR